MLEFFQKYHAVPANDYGPQWDRATDEALAGWAKSLAESWDANPTDRGILRSRMVEVGNELWKRMERIPEADRELWQGEGPRPPYSRLLNGWDGIFRRVGYRWAVVK
jgi:hypothetical protein